MSLLAVENLTLAFGGKRVVSGVSFTLDAGETLALVGESGSGKSLTALSIPRLLPAGCATLVGRVDFAGNDMRAADEDTLQRLRGGQIGMVFQEPMTSLNPLHQVGPQIAEAIRLHAPPGRYPKGTLRGRVADALTQAGFADAEHRLMSYPHQLSGGERQRVMIAMALANAPKLLIADEPTTALDVTIQKQILDLLAEQKQSRHLALLLITHDLQIVRRYADRVCVMKNGAIVEHGPAAAVFAAPSHPYTRALLAAEPSGDPPPPLTAAPTLVEADGVCVRFAIRRGLLRRAVGEVKAVDGISFKVHAGETVALVGESGSGKSSTGFASLRLQRYDGRIAIEGQDIAALGKRAMRNLRAHAQIVFQDPYGSLSPRLHVGDIVAEGLRLHARLSRADRRARVASALAEVGLSEDSIDRFPHEFSGGQRQRIAIARAMILNPRYVVLDEPTSALDVSVQAQIVALLRRLQQDHGLGYLFISHDLRVVRALAHRIIVMKKGRVIEHGDAHQILTAPSEAYTRKLISAA